MDARDATIAQLRAEVANNRQTIALLRDQLNATQAALAAATGAQLAPAPPQLVVAAAKAYKLVHAEPDNVAHQIQVQRTGAIRRIVDKRRQLKARQEQAHQAEQAHQGGGSRRGSIGEDYLPTAEDVGQYFQ